MDGLWLDRIARICPNESRFHDPRLLFAESSVRLPVAALAHDEAWAIKREISP
jgi:hypothetical protein